MQLEQQQKDAEVEAKQTVMRLRRPLGRILAASPGRYLVAEAGRAVWKKNVSAARVKVWRGMSRLRKVHLLLTQATTMNQSTFDRALRLNLS